MNSLLLSAADVYKGKSGQCLDLILWISSVSHVRKGLDCQIFEAEYEFKATVELLASN